MRYLDVCAGISASTVAWRPLGWEAAAYSEIEAAPRAVLAHHYPDTPLHGDFTTIQGDEYGPIDLLVGGTPCQDFSVAGLRKGLAGERGNLTLEYLRLADRTRPRWVVWENVPGVLSIDGGRAFGAFLGGLAQLGYGFAYRVLDAQYAGVPQRRRRVFVVGCAGGWRRAAAVLLERHSLRGDPAPRREAGQIAAGSLTSSLGRRGGQPNGGDTPGHLIPAAFGGGNRSGAIDVAACLVAKGQKCDFEVETFIADVASTLPAGGNSTGGDRQPGTSAETASSMLIAFNAREDCSAGTIAGALGSSSPQAQAIAWGISSDAIDRSGEGDGSAAERAGLGIVEGASPTLRARGRDAVAVAFDMRGREGGAQFEGPHDTANIRAASGGSSRSYVAASAVRRLTPRECERLQGFPDDYTLVPHRGKLMADGPRYKALGNSMAVPVMRWIGERIAAVEALPDRAAA